MILQTPPLFKYALLLVGHKILFIIFSFSKGLLRKANIAVAIQSLHDLDAHYCY